MKYYALFLNTKGFIEQCLALIRYICNPESKNYPHITVRVYKDSHMGIERINHKKISYVNMIEAGAFNLNEKKPPYTVYIRFESEELEALDYKPDYPMSFMHLTLYDGNDNVFAKSLLKELKNVDWHVRLSFDIPLNLKTNTIGKKMTTQEYKGVINEMSYNILNLSIDEVLEKCTDNHSRILQIVRVLDNLKQYLKKDTINRPRSYYESSLHLEKKDARLFFEDGVYNLKEYAKDIVYVTPPEYAREMAGIAFKYLDSSKDVYFGDSAIGTGALYLAILIKVKENKALGYTIKSAIGVDVNKHMALEAKRRYSTRGLTIVWGDSLLPMIDSYLGKKRNIMLVNPPYSRSSDIPIEYRKMLQEYAFNQTGIQISGRAALYVYHIMIMDKWLDNNGVAVWLIPSIFLQTEYGRALRLYLLNNVRLLHIHLYTEEKAQFEKAMVSTCLLVFKKMDFQDEDRVVFSHGDTIRNSKTIEVTKRKLSEKINNWRLVINSIDNKFLGLDTDTNSFSDLFDIKRGLATGANSFFVISEEDVLNLEIPEIAIKPVLPKARFLSSNIILGDERGYPCVYPHLFLIDCELEEDVIRENYPSFYHYLQTAKKKDNGKAITERALVKSRKPWYKQEVREAPLYVLTYMGRNKKDSPPLYFLLNQTKALALNTYICLYPKEWLRKLLVNDNQLQVDLLHSLNKTAEYIIAKQTRIYAGAFQKIEPNELKHLNVIDLPEKIRNAPKR